MKFIGARLGQMAVATLCCAVLFCGCAKDSDVVIKVNDQNITKAEYYKEFNQIKNAQFKNVSREAKKDTSFAVLALKERYTSKVIINALLNQEFAKRKIEVAKEEIEAKRKEIVQQLGSEEQLQKVLKDNNVSEEMLISDIERELKLEKLVKSLGFKEVSDADAQQFYNKNKESFKTPEKVLASHILIETNPETIKRNIADADKNASLSVEEMDKKVAEEVAKKEALAKEVLAKAKANPKDFAKLAKTYSDDKGSAEKGGDLGFVARGVFVKEFEDAAFSQKIGVVGPLVKSQFGTHIIIVYDKAKAGVQTFDQVKNDIKAYLNQQKKEEVAQKFISGLKANAKIEYVDESLNPENIQKELSEAIKKQLEGQQKTDENKPKKEEQKK